MSEDTKLDRLHATALFARCDRKELSRLGEIIDTVEVKARYELIRQGHRTHHAYVVESGVSLRKVCVTR